jgi:hypothetical protein
VSKSDYVAFMTILPVAKDIRSGKAKFNRLRAGEFLASCMIIGLRIAFVGSSLDAYRGIGKFDSGMYVIIRFGCAGIKSFLFVKERSFGRISAINDNPRRVDRGRKVCRRLTAVNWRCISRPR